MAQPIRYQPQELYGEQGDVTTHVGLDPLTGLPVLIYRFPGAPTVSVGVLESENIPGILSSDHDNDGGQLVTAYSRDYGLVAPGEVTLTPAFVVEAARGLRDAARSGVVHGDLRPSRFLHAEGHVLIEGYGVPWKLCDTTFAAPEGAEQGGYAADVYGFAKSMLHLGREQFPTGLIVALERGLARDPAARPDAQELYEAVKAALLVMRTPPEPHLVEAGFGELTLPVQLDQLELLDENVPAKTGGGSAPLTPFDGHLPFDDDDDEIFWPADGGEPEPLTINTDPGERSVPRPSAPTSGNRPRNPAGDSIPGFVKNLPPGATYHSGEVGTSAPPAAFTFDFEEAAPRRQIDWRRVGLIGSLTVAVLAAVTTLFLLRPRTNFGSLGSGSDVHYVVEVTVEPASLPPVTLIVVDSPSSSRWRPGTIFGTAPGQVVLDREGRWSFVGEYQQRRSEVVTLEVPNERSFTLVVPAPPVNRAP